MNDSEARAKKTARYAKAYGSPDDNDVLVYVTIDNGETNYG